MREGLSFLPLAPIDITFPQNGWKDDESLNKTRGSWSIRFGFSKSSSSHRIRTVPLFASGSHPFLPIFRSAGRLRRVPVLLGSSNSFVKTSTSESRGRRRWREKSSAGRGTRGKRRAGKNFDQALCHPKVAGLMDHLWQPLASWMWTKILVFSLLSFFSIFPFCVSIFPTLFAFPNTARSYPDHRKEEK